MSDKFGFVNKCEQMMLASAEDGQLTAVRNFIQSELKCSQLVRSVHFDDLLLTVEVAKLIADTLQQHKEVVELRWSDLNINYFKTNVGDILSLLFDGIDRANARLAALDLSNNPIDFKNFVPVLNFLNTPSCLYLHELSLGNCNIGSHGAKALTKALLEVQALNIQFGCPMQLKIFSLACNRIENEGAEEIATALLSIGSLESIDLSRNLISVSGMIALANAVAGNPKLQLLNISDNTMPTAAVLTFVQALPLLPNLTHLDVNDCLLSNDNALVLANALSQCKCKLQFVDFSHNDIELHGALALIAAIGHSSQLECLKLFGNKFKKTDLVALEQSMLKMANPNALSLYDLNASALSNGEGDTTSSNNSFRFANTSTPNIELELNDTAAKYSNETLARSFSLYHSLLSDVDGNEQSPLDANDTNFFSVIDSLSFDNVDEDNEPVDAEKQLNNE